MIDRIAVFIVVGMVACTANDDIHAPQIAAVTPDHATSGIAVTIVGSYFCQQIENPEDPLACLHLGNVTFGFASATVTQYTDAAIMAEVPGGAGVQPITVSSNGRSSNAVDFTIE